MYYAIVSDVHANHLALHAVDRVVKELRLEFDPYQMGARPLRYWFLGDLLGYGPDPRACLEWLRYTSKLENRWVPGNHDDAVAWLLEQGIGQDTTSAPSSKQAHSSATSSDQANISWQKHAEILRQPENSSYLDWFQREVKLRTEEETSLITEQHPALTCVFTHASTHPDGRRTHYHFAWDHYQTILAGELQTLWDQHGGPGQIVCLFHGHTHYPIVAQLAYEKREVTYHAIPYGQPIPLTEGTWAINPGSVGQPRDGDPRASFAVLDIHARTITFHRVMYDVLTTIERLRLDGYPDSLVKLVSSANGGANLTYYRQVYQAPDLERLPIVEAAEGQPAGDAAESTSAHPS
ncbi:MAG TPA: metallophosphoesterase family protein [Ardenticatenaceae bacterium]|jgi:diadenosine tetraphosphatase ApaH/serine/threonine PP2A family protein phosphatase